MRLATGLPESSCKISHSWEWTCIIQASAAEPRLGHCLSERWTGGSELAIAAARRCPPGIWELRSAAVSAELVEFMLTGKVLNFSGAVLHVATPDHKELAIFKGFIHHTVNQTDHCPAGNGFADAWPADSQMQRSPVVWPHGFIRSCGKWLR